MLLIFFNHCTISNTFYNSTVSNSRTKDGQKDRDREAEGYKETVRWYTFAWEAVGPVAWYHDFTSTLSQQKPVALPKEAVLPCLFLWMIILASAFPVPPPFTSYSGPAQALMQKTANWAKYSYFYPRQLPNSSLCCHTTVSAGICQGIKKGRKGVICMGEREVPFSVAMFSIAGSSWWWNSTVSVETFFYKQKREVRGWTMNLLVGCFKGAPPCGTQWTEGKIISIY